MERILAKLEITHSVGIGKNDTRNCAFCFVVVFYHLRILFVCSFCFMFSLRYPSQSLAIWHACGCEQIIEIIVFVIVAVVIIYYSRPCVILYMWCAREYVWLMQQDKRRLAVCVNLYVWIPHCGMELVSSHNHTHTRALVHTLTNYQTTERIKTNDWNQ